MQKPTAIIFDVNETLLDLAPLKRSVGAALGGREDLLPLWFSTLLHYSLVETLTGDHRGLGEIGVAALLMVADREGVELTHQDAEAAILAPLLSLPPHPDVVAGLESLAESGFRLVSLTNSSAEGAETQVSNAGLRDLFEKRFSVESVQKYKPHPDTYGMVVEALGVEANDAMMVAAHAWDLMGARNAGLRTAFVARPGASLYPNVARPDHVVTDLLDLAQILRQTKREDE